MKKIADAFTQLEILKEATPSTVAHLASVGFLTKLEKGEHLFNDKDKASALYFLIEGFVTIYKVNSNGEKKIIFALDPGKVINVEILNKMPTSAACETMCDCLILGIPLEDFLTVMESDIALTRSVIGALSTKVRRLYRQLKNTPASIRGDKKLAAKLWKLSLDMGKSGAEGVEIDMDITVTYLSEMLGAKRETVSRQLKLLSEDGLVNYKKNRFTVPDREKLRQYFQSS